MPPLPTSTSWEGPVSSSPPPSPRAEASGVGGKVATGPAHGLAAHRRPLRRNRGTTLIRCQHLHHSSFTLMVDGPWLSSIVQTHLSLPFPYLARAQAQANFQRAKAQDSLQACDAKDHPLIPELLWVS